MCTSTLGAFLIRSYIFYNSINFSFQISHFYGTPFLAEISIGYTPVSIKPELHTEVLIFIIKKNMSEIPRLPV